MGESVAGSELISHTLISISQTVSAAKSVVIQKENFAKFSTFLEKIALILKGFSEVNIKNSGKLRNAIEILSREIGESKQLAIECSKRNRIYLLISCRKILLRLESSTRRIGRSLNLIPLATLDSSPGTNHDISKLCKDMLSTAYHITKAEEEALEKIELGLQESQVDQSYANNLLFLISEAIGVSIKTTLKSEFQEFRSEAENSKPINDPTESRRMDQILALLGKANATPSSSERKLNYLKKRNSLGSQPLEPLQSFFCPITKEVMEDPMETNSGRTFERSAIEKWLAVGHSQCPLTMTPLDISSLRPNKSLKQSIEEWRERNIMILIASLKPKLLSDKVEEVIDSLNKLQDLCMESEIHREWVALEDYIPLLIGLLGAKDQETRKHALIILWILAKHSDDNKEKITDMENAIESIAHSLARRPEESKLALQLLLVLSSNEPVRYAIGRVQGCILLLVTLANSHDTQVANDAQELLEVVSFLDQNVAQMARANYFEPLLHLLRSGPKNSKMIMAATLSEIELTNNNKLSLYKDGVLEPLLELLSDTDIEMKKVAVRALQNLSTLPEIGLQMTKAGAISPLLDLLYHHSLSVPSLQEQVAVIVMHLAMATTGEEADQVQAPLIESEEEIFKLFSLINLAGPEIRISILQSFLAMSQSSYGLDIRTKLRQLSTVQVLIQLCELNKGAVRTNAVMLFCCLTEDGEHDTFLEHVDEKCIKTILGIIKTSDDPEEIVAALGIISNLPKDTQLSQWLLDAGALEIIICSFKNGTISTSQNGLLLANAVGALRHFTAPMHQEWQKKAAEAGVISVLVRFLVSGTALTKQYAAMSLKQFSESSSSLSQPIEKKGLFACCFTSPETCCPVHLGICSVESSFCLLEANALGPLVKNLDGPDSGACEASLDALLTLIDAEKLQSGSKVLDGANAIAPMIKLLSSPCISIQEKALMALERLFRLLEIKHKYAIPVQMPLVEITQRGDAGMKSLAAKVLAHLNMLHQQSSYF
ncbi:Armadillo [Dillenia turbinata]|uniref:RING-type E3 ubiquitin transferase n=1 Tax=Dillenia turbinata TaxID=194707 RepID=A0AAN8Z5V1_9MAGN